MNFINRILLKDLKPNVWDFVDGYELKNFPWDKTGYKPKVIVKMFYTEKDFRVKFTATEKSVRAENIEINSSVYQDSCVEFFINPDYKNSDDYLNFEINAIGTLLSQVGENSRKREFLSKEEINTYINITSDVNLDNILEFDNFKPWNVELVISFDLIKKYFPLFKADKDKIIKCNFYKCGDKTDIPHYACLENIDYYKPSFHRPEFFKEILLK